MIFQSPSLAKIQLKLGELVFCDATYFICPAISYQIFITRVYSPITHSYYTTSFSIMNNKKETTYKLIFKKLHENITKYLEIGEGYNIRELHTDFEIAIGKACKLIYPNVNIKHCIWHWLRALEINKNKICLNEISNNDDLFILYRILCNLYVYDPYFVLDVFKLIKEKSENSAFGEFLKYFEEQYILRYGIKTWNYYDNYIHITNNSCESYNCKLNKLFKIKPSFFKLLYELRIEEQDIVNSYKKGNVDY